GSWIGVGWWHVADALPRNYWAKAYSGVWLDRDPWQGETTMIDDRVGGAGPPRGERGYINDTATDRPVTDVLKDIAANVQEMVQAEIRLARAEIREETKKTIRAGKLLGAGAALGVLAGEFVFAGVALVLALFIPIWAATF